MCLQAMFSLCMVESEADEVTLQGVTSVGLKHALDFAYTGQVSPERRPRHKTRCSAQASLIGSAASNRLTFIRICVALSRAARLS